MYSYFGYVTTFRVLYQQDKLVRLLSIASAHLLRHDNTKCTTPGRLQENEGQKKKKKKKKNGLGTNKSENSVSYSIESINWIGSQVM